VEVDETMIETPTYEMDVEVESEELQEAQAPSIVDDSLVCLSCFTSPSLPSPLTPIPVSFPGDCHVLKTIADE